MIRKLLGWVFTPSGLWYTNEWFFWMLLIKFCWFSFGHALHVRSFFGHGVYHCYGYGGKECFRLAPVLLLYLLPSCFARRAKEVNLIGLKRQKERTS